MTANGVLLAVCAALIAAHLRPKPEPPVRRGALPDLVVITLDTTRASNLGPWGYFRDTTPHLDALAADALVFEQFIVPMATTLPTHTSLFTGTFPLEHGITANVVVTGRRLLASDQLVPLATWARERGYATGGFVSSSPLKRGTGIEAGFDAWTEPAGSQRRAATTTAHALGWLDEVGDRPVLLWVHYIDPHYPWSPPEDFTNPFGPSDAQAEWIAARVFRGGKTGRARAGRRLDGYDGEIAYMDAQIGVLLDGMRDRGRFDDAVLVVAGDHGEGLGQHGHLEHGLVWEEQLHAPLLMRLPGRAPGRVSTLVTASDVLPTVFGAVEIPGAADLAAQFSGVDVLGERVDRPGILSMTSDRQLKFGVATTYSLTTPEWKYVMDTQGARHLYARTVDPHELVDVLADHPELADGFDAVVRERVADLRSRGEALGAGRTEAVSPRMLRQLQELGYLE